jgi:hypothetical protein
MIKQRKYKQISFRVSDDTWESLEIKANLNKQKINLTARDLMLEGLFDYDSKQEYLVSRLDKQDEEISKLLRMSALSVATSSLPLEQSGYDREKLRELIKTHLFDSSALSKSVLDMLEKGKI